MTLIYPHYRSRPRRPPAASSLFQKRSVQVLIIGLIGVMAVSMAAMAAIYIMGQVNEDGSTGTVPMATCSVLWVLRVAQIGIYSTPKSRVCMIASGKGSNRIHSHSQHLSGRNLCCIFADEEIPHFPTKLPDEVPDLIANTTKLLTTTAASWTTSPAPIPPSVAPTSAPPNPAPVIGKQHGKHALLFVRGTAHTRSRTSQSPSCKAGRASA